ncbi:hypothetical protein D3H65_00050 [Paraflavitalea soli]|uniref:Uncharacterized protein n=1 Tax=Paraflavitalea soli TaxID=2315862 RepID=A0A3B7MGL8_9BACT|nr:hypothetical protein [Paraflavitalea soli]AXY72463.1 hypothetical protein D3H65_00050 [Paraflavitalea soli]
MNKTKQTDSSTPFPALEKAMEKAIKESYHFRDAQTGKFVEGQSKEGKNKSASVKITIKH